MDGENGAAVHSGRDQRATPFERNNFSFQDIARAQRPWRFRGQQNVAGPNRDAYLIPGCGMSQRPFHFAGGVPQPPAPDAVPPPQTHAPPPYPIPQSPPSPHPPPP